MHENQSTRPAGPPHPDPLPKGEGTRQPVAIPLYTPPPHPDAWHQVRAPGGYEWWYFDADDLENDRHLAAILFQGFVFHPGYLRRHFRYLRWPTRFAPALPQEYPCAYFVLYERGAIRWQLMSQFAPAAFAAATEHLDVSVGPNRAACDSTGYDLSLRGTPWQLTWRGPQRLEHLTLEAHLRFEPRLRHAPQERVFLSRAMTAAAHHWVIAAPLCDVQGTIRVGTDEVHFSGRGYHDHNYGTGPLGPGLHRWMWGRVLLDNRAYTFHFARGRDRRVSDEVHLVEAAGDSMREIPVSRVSADFSRRSKLLLAYPAEVVLDDALRLSAPQIIDSAPFYMRLKYEARLPDGARGTALCEIAYPHRLRWPILGRMIEMSIDRRGTLV